MSLSPVLVGPDPVCASASGAIAAHARAIIFNFICSPFVSVHFGYAPERLFGCSKDQARCSRWHRTVDEPSCCRFRELTALLQAPQKILLPHINEDLPARDALEFQDAFREPGIVRQFLSHFIFIFCADD
jgi:hypothetical protein